MSSTTIHGSRKLERSDLTGATQPVAELTADNTDRDIATACRQIANVCGFPALHADAVLTRKTRLDQDRAAAYGKATEAIKRRGLVLMYGDRGRGKTFLATLIGANWWKHGFYAKYGACRYWTVTDLMDAQRAWFGKKTNEHGPVAEPFEVARDCGLLVLDELNETRDSAFDADSLVRIVDARYRSMMPTVLLTNLKPESFVKVLGASVVDRTKDRGAVIECNWDNYRDRLRSQGGAA
jgi:DNA replication protein DnaC